MSDATDNSVSTTAAAVPASVTNLNQAVQTNVMTAAFGHKYFEDFSSIFEITKTGALRSNKEKLHQAEEWFNQSYVFISLISGVPLTPIQFIYDIGFGDIHPMNLNRQTMLHIYSVSYAVLLRFSTTLNRPVPPQYLPVANITQFEEDNASLSASGV